MNRYLRPHQTTLELPIRLPDEPTFEPPGSAARIGVYRERFLSGRAIFHPDDAVCESAGWKHATWFPALFRDPT